MHLVGVPVPLIKFQLLIKKKMIKPKLNFRSGSGRQHKVLIAFWKLDS